MLKSCFRITGPHFIGKRLYLFHPDAVQDDMYMDIPALVMPVLMSADQHLMSGKMCFRIGQAKFLRPFHCQPPLPVLRLKTDDIMVRLDFPLILIFPILLIDLPALSRKVVGIAVHSCQQIVFSHYRIPLFVPEHLLCLFIMLEDQIPFSRCIVRIFTGDMFDDRHYSSPAISSIFLFSWLKSARQWFRFFCSCAVKGFPSFRCLEIWLILLPILPYSAAI